MLHRIVIILITVAAVLAVHWHPAAQAAGTSPLTIKTAEREHPFMVEVATTTEQQARGLMYRRELAPDAGMLFVYRTVAPVAMWMKNTLIPLDMLFIGRDGRIAHIVQRTVPLSTELIASNGPAYAVLELNGGTVSRLGIKTGDSVLHPSLRQ